VGRLFPLGDLRGWAGCHCSAIAAAHFVFSRRWGGRDPTVERSAGLVDPVRKPSPDPPGPGRRFRPAYLGCRPRPPASPAATAPGDQVCWMLLDSAVSGPVTATPAGLRWDDSINGQDLPRRDERKTAEHHAAQSIE